MQPALTIRHQLLIGFVCVVLSALLLTARVLEPAQQGYGTHQQLGLPVCTSMACWGVRCPACGMTTSWAWATRGRWMLALNANAGGVLLATIAMALVPLGCYWLVVGKTLPGDRTWLLLGLGLLSTLAVAIAQWGWRLLS